MATQVLGAAIKRREDPPFLTGSAKFTADLEVSNAAHVAILHSTHAHARLKKVDPFVGARMQGVARFFPGADVAGKMLPLVCFLKPAEVEILFPPHPYGVP